MKAKCTLFSLILAGLFLALPAWAQKQTPLDIALRYLEQQREQWQLTAGDIADVAVSDQYQSRHNKVTHLYFIQRYAGIELYNAISGVHVAENGRVGFATNGFTSDLASRVNTTTPNLTAYEAIEAAATHLGLVMDGALRLLDKPGDKEFVYEGGNISNSNIRVKLVYQLTKEGKALLAWGLAIDMPTGADYWSMRIDALTAEVLGQNNWTVYCNFDADAGHLHGPGCGLGERAGDFQPVARALEMHNLSLVEGAQYNVFPAPAESPRHGLRELLTDPHDPAASPFGWHDVNGQDGPEYTITRGNNVHAYQDADADNDSAGDEPDGGSELLFDFPFDPMLEPEGYTDAATTQLFYMNNYIHDFTYAYGFDEASGNFQQNNYGNGGSGSDPVNAEAQDGSGNNNANFATPPDGGNGRMQMYLWNASGSSIFSVNSPQSVAGAYEVQQAGFGGQIPDTPLTAEIATVDDGANQPSLGCEALVNGDVVAGKIALIDRGVCEFGLKSLNAEEAGAVAVIICNFEDALVSMGGGAVGSQVTIPVISMTFSDCQTIRQFEGEGLTATFFYSEEEGPRTLDASFDNGIIAHEYGHGISNRLTGGPNQAGCLSNDEQMGEGWSDFFTLITSVKDGDVGETPRGIGTYVLGREPGGLGIRRQSYSTDMSVNNQTYEDIVGTTAPHPLGEVWAATLWDLYWAMVDVHGWDPDQAHGSGGNNMAIQLVMDGMKLQQCNPGFIAGRDAILAADRLNYEGANQCLIWEVFTRRGFGYLADGGSTFDRNDGTESFELIPECLNGLYINKEVTELIEAGEEIFVTLEIANYKNETATEVVATDIIPAGASYIGGSAEGATPEVFGDAITFALGELEPGQEITITYRLSTDPSAPSILQFGDDMENGEDNWILFNLTGVDIWGLTEFDAYSGEESWYIPEVEAENDQVLQLLDPIVVEGTQPVLRFFHRYETEYSYDGGFVEISTDGGGSWRSLNEEIFRNPYPRPLAYGTFAIPFLRAYSGSTGGEWVSTYADLSAFAGEEVSLRWRFGSDEAGIANAFMPGWYVDDVAIMDMVYYNAEACVTDAGGGQACDLPEGRGTIIADGIFTGTEEETAAAELRIFPNPAQSLLNVAITVEKAQEATLSIVSTEGRIMQEQQAGLVSGSQLIPVNISSLPAGFYFVRVNTLEGSVVEKVMIQ